MHFKIHAKSQQDMKKGMEEIISEFIFSLHMTYASAYTSLRAKWIIVIFDICRATYT